MADVPLPKKFEILCEITRAQHFAWHAAVRELYPPVDPMEVTLEMWRITGRQTGRAYARKINRQLPIAPQIAESICWSSQCMGEDAIVEKGANDQEAFVVHRACPWLKWHQKNDLLREDRPGCDAWFESTIEAVNEELGSNVKFETQESLPDGGATCRRRLWG